MGASQIGEAIAIVQNVDMAIILNRITNSVKNAAGQVEYEDKYLMLNCVASRGNSPSINKFQIRFANGNDLRLISRKEWIEVMGFHVLFERLIKINWTKN